MAGLRYASPERRLQTERQRVDESARRAASAFLHAVELKSVRLRGMASRLQALSPLAVLGRGYAVITRQTDGGLVTRLDQAEDRMDVRVSDGVFKVRKA